MFRLHQLAVFAAMSGGAYSLIQGPQYLNPATNFRLLTPVEVALGHAYNGCGGGNRRGKHKAGRHGQKPKSCRNKISRRVRRKHRRAAA